MEILTLMTLAVIGLYLLRAQEQRRRVALLAAHLGKYQIERLMENLTEGYLRCLGEEDPERRDQIWRLLDTNEATLAGQFESFAADFSRIDAAEARVFKFAIDLPWVRRLFPGATFDARKAFALHARAIADASANIAQRSAKSKAFTLSAELFLMQHTCHWFCRSRTIASARLLARHKTSYAQVVDAVAPATRRAYEALIGGG